MAMACAHDMHAGVVLADVHAFDAAAIGALASVAAGGNNHPEQPRQQHAIHAGSGFNADAGKIRGAGAQGKAMENGRPVVAGVVTSDVALEWLTRLVAGVSVLDTGYAYLISQSGTYITHPEPSVAFNETIFTRAEEFHDQQLRSIGQDMIHGGSRFVRVKSLHAGKDGFLMYAPLPSTGWSLAVFFPRDEMLARVHRQAMNTTFLEITRRYKEDRQSAALTRE